MEREIDIEIGKRVKMIRKQLGMTLVEFGDRLGVTYAAVSMIERGKNGISNQGVKNICREFKVSETWLRTGNGNMFVEIMRDEEIAAFMGDILRDDYDFKRRFISALAKLQDDDWKLLERTINGIAGTNQNPAQ